MKANCSFHLLPSSILSVLTTMDLKLTPMLVLAHNAKPGSVLLRVSRKGKYIGALDHQACWAVSLPQSYAVENYGSPKTDPMKLGVEVRTYSYIL